MEGTAPNSPNVFPIKLMVMSSGPGTCCSGRVTRWALPHDQDASASHIACTWRAFTSTYPYLQHYHKQGLSHPSANPGPTLTAGRDCIPSSYHLCLLSLCPNVQRHQAQIPLSPTQWPLDVVILWHMV